MRTTAPKISKSLSISVRNWDVVILFYSRYAMSLKIKGLKFLQTGYRCKSHASLFIHLKLMWFSHRNMKSSDQFCLSFKYPPRVSILFKVIRKASRRDSIFSTFQPRQTSTFVTSYWGQYVLFGSKYGSRDRSMWVNYFKGIAVSSLNGLMRRQENF